MMSKLWDVAVSVITLCNTELLLPSGECNAQLQ